MRAVAAVALGIALGVTSLGASAQGSEPTAAEIAVARKLFAEAAALEKAEKWVEAEAKLREAIAIKETPGLRYHLGFALEQQGKLVAALVEYDRASELLGSGVKAADVSELVGPAAERVRGRVAQVTVKLAMAPRDAKIELDGTPVKAALIGKAMPANPGKHVITGTAPGHQSFRKEITLAEAQTAEVSIDMPVIRKVGAGPVQPGGTPSAGQGSESSAPPEPDSSAGSKGSGGSTRTYVLIGEAALVAIGAGAGIFYFIDKGNAQDQVDIADTYIKNATDPKDKQNYQKQRADLVDQRDRASMLSTLGFVGAGAGAAALITTLLVWKPAKTERATWVTPVAFPAFGGLAAGARF
jgi:tetratricopeptide (TPR) repeat protein